LTGQEGTRKKLYQGGQKNGKKGQRVLSGRGKKKAKRLREKGNDPEEKLRGGEGSGQVTPPGGRFSCREKKRKENLSHKKKSKRDISR